MGLKICISDKVTGGEAGLGTTLRVPALEDCKGSRNPGTKKSA